MKSWQIPSIQTRSGQETMRLVVEISRLHERLSSAWDELSQEFGLTNARWQVLGAIRDEPRTASGIARFMGLTRQSVQRTVVALEADGFVALSENPDHARARLAGLTDKGAETLAALDEKLVQWVNALAGEMEPANMRIATGIMRGLVNRLVDPKSEK